jgi:hypothetical protein
MNWRIKITKLFVRDLGVYGSSKSVVLTLTSLLTTMNTKFAQWPQRKFS